MKLYFQNLLGLSALLILLVTAGCSKSLNLKVATDIPAPLSSQIPLVLGTYYNEDFRNYAFKEDSEARKDWTIATGESGVTLFDHILPSMFKTVKPLTEGKAPADQSAVDIIFEPNMVEMQVAIPEETHTDMYEAWVKYAIKLYQPAGDVVSEWQITGYGKAETSMFTNIKEGLNMAINLALRDVGAKLVLNFPKAPGIRDWLVGKIDCSAYPGVC